MSSLCIVCLGPMAVSFLINCIRWIQRFHCRTHTEIERMSLGKCVFVLIIRISPVTDNTRLNKMILWYSRRIMAQAASDHAEQALENRIALPRPIIRAYFSLCWNCQNCIYDCRSMSIRTVHSDTNHIRGPCVPADFYALTTKKRRIDMSKNENNSGKSLYEQQENKLSQAI